MSQTYILEPIECEQAEPVIGTDLSTVDTLSNTTLTGKWFYEEQGSCQIDLNLYWCSYSFFSFYCILLTMIDFFKNVFKEIIGKIPVTHASLSFDLQ
jgi:hypothetical protein